MTALSGILQFPSNQLEMETNKAFVAQIRKAMYKSFLKFTLTTAKDADKAKAKAKAKAVAKAKAKAMAKDAAKAQAKAKAKAAAMLADGSK